MGAPDDMVGAPPEGEVMVDGGLMDWECPEGPKRDGKREDSSDSREPDTLMDLGVLVREEE